MDLSHAFTLFVLTLIQTTPSPSDGSTTPPPVVNCNSSDITSGTKSPTSATVVFNTSVTYTCDVGYEITSGDAVRTCESSGVLSGTLPLCSIKKCNSENVSNADMSPNSTTFDYNTTVTYSCNLGYNYTSGDLVRTCQADSNWSGTAPTCTIVTCAEPANVTLATKSPIQSSYDYDQQVTYVCDTGYKLASGNLTRTCMADGTWSGALPACTNVTCEAPAAVDFSSHSPVSDPYLYNEVITYTCNLGYEVTGGSSNRTCQADGAFSGSAPVCSISACIQENSTNMVTTPNKIFHGFNDVIVYSCILGYNHSSGDLSRTCENDGNWTGSKPECVIVKCPKPTEAHTTVSPNQTQYDFNTSVTSTCTIGYNLTGGDVFRTCQHTGVWDGTAPNCTIVECDAPSPVPLTSLAPTSAIYIYQETLNYTCETGYEVTSGNDTRTCTETGEWTGSPPNCTIIHCPIPPDGTNSSYSPALLDYIYNDTIVHTCYIGYNHSSGDLERRCLEDKTWSGATPACTIVTCDKIDVPHMTFTPPTSDTHDFNTTIEYSCDIGYNHSYGDLVRTCNYTGEWTGNLPNCTISACIQENSTYMVTTPNKILHGFNDVIVYGCILGYNHSSGDLSRTCQNDGNWTGSMPECVIVTCDTSNVPAHASIVPNVPEVNYNTSITYVCDLGYNRTDGDETRRCREDATFEGVEANCTLVTCNPPDPISNGTYGPVLAQHDYNTTVNFTCDFGYYHFSGNLSLRCDENASWFGTIPVCEIVQCPKPTEGNTMVSPNQTQYNFNTSVTSTCIIGYNLTGGDVFRTCQHTGVWDGTPPNCTIVECDAPAPVPFTSLAPTSAIYSYQDTLNYTCETGYEVTSGNDTRTCTETGEWTGSPPNCTIIHCPIPPDGANSSYSPALLDYIYNDTIVHTCYIGYNHSSGDLEQRCLEDKTWSGATPACTIITCDKIDVANMTFTPPTADSHDFNTTVEYSCDIGYNHTYGDLFRTCNYTGEWTGTLPSCTIIECDAPPSVLYSSLVPQLSVYVYLDTLTYTCDIGYEVTSGNDTRTCKETTEWTGTAPNCTIIHCPIPPDGANNTYSPALLDYIYNDTIVHTCNIGYNHSSGNLERRCTENKTWSGETPVCNIVTCDKIDVLHMTFTPPTSDTHDFNTTIQYSCDIGYNHSYGDLVRTCNYTGEWTGSLPNCTIIECDAPPLVIHSSLVPMSSVYVYLDNLTYTCDIGYEITDGDDNRTCTETSEWTGTAPNCTIIHCPIPPDGANSSYSPALLDYIYNDTIVHTCNIGYNHSSGDLERRCTENKTWSGETPVCTIVTCDKIDVLHMTFTPPTSDTHDFNTTIEYSCDIGYNHSYGDLVRTCNYTGEWTGTLPNCTIIECDAPPLVIHSSLVPVSSVYVYLDNLTYTCDIGYEITDGDDNRTCTETSEWTGTAPNCTIIHCPIPPDGANNTYSPALLDYIYNDTIVHTCNIGFNHSSGDLERRCTENKTWSGETPVCTIVTCDKIDVQHMTFEPPTADTHDFNTTIEYSCNVGYNHSYGDLIRTCNFTAEWTGTLPECEIITCDPPDPIPHTTYVPTLVEHDWNTTIYYSCDADYHYISGVNDTTCNESGSFPPANTDCSVKHFMALSASEPSLTWFNASSYSVNTTFDFDGVCDVTISCVPNLDGITHTINGNQLVMTVTQTATTVLNEYLCTLKPFHGERNYSNIIRDVFFGTEILGFWAYLDNPIIYLAVGEAYTFIANATDGSNVTLQWEMESGITEIQTYPGAFSIGSLSYAFNLPKHNITVHASNVVSNHTRELYVEVIYRINGFNLWVVDTLANTTDPTYFDLHLLPTANIPMHDVNISIDFKHGSNATDSRSIDEFYGVDVSHNYNHLFDFPGFYFVEAKVQNILGEEVYNVSMRIWDSLLPLKFEFINAIKEKYIITNNIAEFSFTNVPNYGYKYTIDYGDGTVEANSSETILYDFYNLPIFLHNYTSPGVYIVHWTANNGEPSYDRDELFAVHVQNEVPDNGYMLEPLSKKYAWSNAQDMDIELNMTLNASVPLPTNATCVFDPDDGNNSVAGLVFDKAFLKYSHGYRTEGLFNATFNCSNDVSYYIYTYAIEIRKFQAKDLEVVYHEYVPLNKSDTVVVYFHIDNGGFVGIPKNVYLTWDFGDGNISEPVLYDKPTYTHLYSERGNYTFTVFVEALISNTTNTLFKSLRLGLMYFEYNTTIQFINSTVVHYSLYGIVGLTNYTIEFDDGTPAETCNSTAPLICDVYHLCAQYGYHLVEVIGTNGTFVEVDNLNVTCDNPLNFIMDIPPSIYIPDGKVNATLRISLNDLFIPWVTCYLNMGDPIKRDTYGPFSQEVTHVTPFMFPFQYIALGRHKITIHCWNLINDTRLENIIIVQNENFVFTGVFDRFYSQQNSPMYISSMIDTEIFSRLNIEADSNLKTHTNFWKLNVSVGETNATRHGLLFTRGLVPEYKYNVILDVCFIEEPTNCIFEPTYVEFVMPPPHAEIVGNTRRYVDKGPVIMDAFTFSYDPVFPTSSAVDFSWECESFDANDFEEASNFLSFKKLSSCSYNEISPGIIEIDTSDKPTKSHYAVTVTVDNKRGKAARFTQIAAVDNDKDLTIICKINCLSKVARSSQLQLIPDLPNNCPATFTWTLKRYSGSAYEDVDISSFATSTGSTSRPLTIKEHTLAYGTRYLVSLTVNLDGKTYGPAFYEFLTNKPPQGGFCKITPYNETTLIPIGLELENTTSFAGEYNLTAGIHVFNITCQDWMDEGFTIDSFSSQEPLFYMFFLSYGDTSNDTHRQLLYFDPGQTSNLVSFQLGNVNDDYRATVVLRIVDVLGDYTDVLYNVRSIPSIVTADLVGLTSNNIYSVVSSYVNQFDEELIKANRTYDYRTIARKVMDIASVYNELALNTSAAVVLSPEDLLSLGHVRTEDDKLLRWDDYWKIIVEVTDTLTPDFLSKVSEKHAEMLRASVLSWPPSKRMTLVAIETITRALNTSTSNLEFSNVTAAVYAAECANIMARNLATISDDRTFPNTERLFTVAIAIRDLARNILAVLQTVLTPNLPQNPTVEEMRNYLNYIMIFKTTEEVINAPLSIQEQTFLAQKQLQKYHFQKYIKSEASKTALPHLTHALRNLTYVLGRLSELGQEELFLENDYIYISVEIKPAFELFGKTLNRPRVALELNGLSADFQEDCDASSVLLRSIVFKHNPYFWGQFADRITSYVPLFEMDGASLTSTEITYRLENKVEAACTDQTPTYEADDPNKMIYILVDRQHAEDDILIFVRPNTSDLIYKLYFNKDEKPKVPEKIYTYTTDMIKDGQMWTPGDGYKLLVKSSEYSETGKIWIGLKPILENSGDLSLLTKKFCANVTSVSCLALRQNSVSGDYIWDKDLCKVSLSSTRTETICTCTNADDMITVGTTFYIPFNTIDFKSIDPVIFEALGRSPVIGMLVASACAYVLLVIWAWREDVKDQYKWSYSLMIDNDIADIHFYIVRVFTGLRTGAGTQSKIAFVLVGEDGDSNIRILDDESHIGFERGSVRTFVMSTRKYLGDLICLRIWHDDSGGNNSSWYLNKIKVTDLKTGMGYTFACDQWLDYDSGDTRVDRVLNAQPKDESRSCQEMLSHAIAEHHLWLSVFMRPFKSNFTRIQRLSCLLGLIYLNMIICTMILKTSDEVPTLQEVVIGPFRYSFENFKTAVISMTISTVIIMVVTFFFKNAESDVKGPNVNSVILKAYRKVNDSLKIDKSVLGRKYWPPAENTVEYNNFFLPSMCVYVGWAILITSVILATYILETFSVDWKLIKSERWMTTIFVSILCSVVLIETAKVIFVLLLYYLVCQRSSEPPEPSVDEDYLEETARYNSATLTIGPQYGSVLEKPENPKEEKLLANKIKRIQNHQLLKILSQLAVYGALLYLVYTISYESRDPRSYYLKNHVENLFQFTSEVTDLESYTTWLKSTFIDNYFSATYFGAYYEGNENKMYMEDLANFRVGPARLRQLRIKPEECIGPLGKGIMCHNKYEESKKETSDYCLGWKNQPCPVSEKASFFSSAAWEFTSADEIWGFPTVAQYCTYGGGGYFMKLDVNRDVCEIIFDELLNSLWFDVQTRAIILEFTLYNVNTNLFVYSKYVAEFPEVGGFLPYIDTQVFRLYLNTGPDGDFILFLEFFFLLIVLAATFACVYEIVTDARAFFRSVWNILDIVALIMSYTTISIFIFKMFVIKRTIEIFENDKNAYVGFENLAFYDFVTNTAFGILVFLLSVRVSRILGYSGKINEMAAVISNAASDLSGFLLIFGITYFAYVIWGTLLFGKEQEKYKDVFQTYGTLTEAIVGKNRVSNILSAKPGFAEFYYFTFVLFVLMTLATMAAAILNFSIAVVKKEQEKLAPTNIVEVIIDRIGKLFQKLRPSEDKKQDKQKNERRDSDAELNDILSDLRFFIQKFKTPRKNKSSDKYRLNDDQATGQI